MAVTVEAYQPEHRSDAVRLMAQLQDLERGLSDDRPPGAAMASQHFDYLLGLCRDTGGAALVAIVDGRVGGFATLVVEQEDEGDRHLYPAFSRYGLISDLVVDERHRGLGVGGQLLRGAEECCRELGLTSIRVAALSANEAARAFYLGSGYLEYEVLFSKRLSG